MLLSCIFDSDWSVAKGAHGFSGYILSVDCTESEDQQEENSAVVPPQRVEDKRNQLDEVKQTLRNHTKAIYDMFEYFATQSGSGTLASIETLHDVRSVKMDLTDHAFTNLCRACGITDDIDCTATELSALFVKINALGIGQSIDEVWNRANALNRREWLQCIVHIAIIKYVLPGHVKGVADAIETLMCRIQEHAPPEVLQDSNNFRKRYCYTELVDKVLRKYMPSLRNIYKCYAAGQPELSAALEDDNWMSAAQWLRLCSDTGLVGTFTSCRNAMQVCHLLGSSPLMAHFHIA